MDETGRIAQRLRRLEERFRCIAPTLAVFLVFDRPSRVDERPGLERAMFRQRCLTEQRLERIMTALREVGTWVRLYWGEDEFMYSAAAREIEESGRALRLVYNGIEGGIGPEAFAPGRKALIPAVSDSYGLLCANSNPYASALGRHKYHYFTVLKAHGVPVPDVWHYRPASGWAGDRRPPKDLEVIAKSTYESWSVGVSEDSVFRVGTDLDDRVETISSSIGQAVCVQEFVPGNEVGVTVLQLPEPVATQPMQVVLHKAENDPRAVMTMEDNLTAKAVSYRPLVSSETLQQHLSRIAVDAFKVLELSAFARMDFRIGSEGTPWISDVGVSPGLGPHGSPSFESLRLHGFDHREFIRIVFAASLLATNAMHV